jgi:hypothetical protein
VIDPFHIALFKAVAVEVDSRKTNLAAGQAEDYATYREAVGIISGLMLALELATRVETERYGTPREGTE